MQRNFFNLPTLESKNVMNIMNCFYFEKTYTTLLLNQSFVDLNRKMLRSLTSKGMCEHLLRVHIPCTFYPQH